MPTDLQQHVLQMPLYSTHSHLKSEQWWTAQSPADPIVDLFGHYQNDDLVSSGMSFAQLEQIQDAREDLARRWEILEPFFRRICHTGYGQKVCIQAKQLYNLDEISLEGLESIRPAVAANRQPGRRLQLLRETANLLGLQVDSFNPRREAPEPEAAGFIKYDISWMMLSCGLVTDRALQEATGIEPTDLASLDAICQFLLSDLPDHLVAIKSQHAYQRTLAWRERTDDEASASMQRVLAQGERADQADRICLGDWLLGRGATLAGEKNLPIKIHTGHAAGVLRMHLDEMSPALLGPLVHAHPKTRFVLMHGGYPFCQELISMAKHFPNVVMDLCWAWAVNPLATGQALQSAIQAVPINKIFGFGDDTFQPTQAVAYAIQARQWIARTLQDMVDRGMETESDAIEIADRIGRANALDYFDLT